MKKTLNIQAIGVGGAGCNAIDHLAGSEVLIGVSFAALNTDAAALEKSAVETRLVLGPTSMRGLGAGGDPERGQTAAEESLAQVRGLCEGADIVFVLAGLGGGTGTGAGPVVARTAREMGALVLGIVMLPFDCEGIRRQRQAMLGLADLKSAADGVICLPNQKIFKLIDEKTSLLEAFHLTNELVAQGVRGIWRLLSRPGLINVDFADLCAVTRGKHGESALASAEAKGENRAREVIEKLLAHPLVEGGQALAEAAGVLVSIAGGPELAMADVNRVMEQINRHCEHAQLIMGAAIEEDLRDRLIVTVVASRRDGVSQTGGPDPSAPSSASGSRHAKEDGSGAADTPELDSHLLSSSPRNRRPSKFVAPPPPLTAETREALLSQQASGGGRQRKSASRLRQGQLPLEIVSKGRFEKSEPTIHHGQDLDVPTYIRRGVALN